MITSETNASETQTEVWYIFVHVCDKIIEVCCGNGRQRIKWLGHVAIAQWDEIDLQGWKRLGIPSGMKTQQGNDLQMGAVIREVLKNRDHIFIRTSLNPSETL